MLGFVASGGRLLGFPYTKIFERGHREACLYIDLVRNGYKITVLVTTGPRK
jgi:hypothetical protein